MATIFGCIDFLLFLVLSKKPLKAYSSYNFGQIFFKITRDDLQTKPHKRYSYNFDPHNRLSGTATQIQQKSRQTGSEVISKQIFEMYHCHQGLQKSFSNQKVVRSIPCQSVFQQDTSFFPFFTLLSSILSFFHSSFQNCEEYTFPPGFAIFGGIRIAACSYI